jgi:geranylgeranyl reductase family protein
MMASFEFDLLIAGAGPAGCTLALNLAPAGLQIGIIEKETFPRHKICGDALSGKVLSVMKRIPGGVYEDFLDRVDKLPSLGIKFVSPDYHSIDVPFILKTDKDQPAPGFVCKRDDFDQFMFGKLKMHPNIRVFEGEELESVVVAEGFVSAKTRCHEFRGRVIAGADGVHSTVRKCLHGLQPEKKHFCVGIRGYYKNVTDLHPDNYIELVFLKKLLPGYFWIFPSTGGLVNAGFGMLQNRISKHRENMAHILHEIIQSDPLIARRFKNATPVGKPEAHTLPLGTCNITRSGNRFILLGDAGFLVDPFSGEGIGNAMASGEIGAEILKNCFNENNFSAGSLQRYDTRIHNRFSKEFRTLGLMQRLAASPGLFNLVVNKAEKN